MSPRPQIHRRVFLLICLAIPFCSLSAEQLGGPHLKDIPDSNGKWLFAGGLNGGYNKLLEGYERYEDLGNLGLDLYVQPPLIAEDEWVRWRDHTLFRLSFDWFPLQVPKGVNGLTEDIYSVNASYLYAFNLKGENPFSWRPFLGIGAGIYRDQLVLDTPATGKISSADDHFGYNFSAGVLLPVWKGRFPVRLVPEIRYHRVKYVESYAANITYQLGLSYWPGARQKP